jgi:hypothetical protein
MFDDLRHSLRFLMREPMLAATIVVTLGLAMASNIEPAVALNEE